MEDQPACHVTGASSSDETPGLSYGQLHPVSHPSIGIIPVNPDFPVSSAQEDNGSLRCDYLDDRVQWTFVPRRDRLMPHPMPPHPAVICEFLVGLGVLRTYPIIPYADNDRYTQPKYDRIRCIQIDLPELVDYTGGDEADSLNLELEEI